jgi:hypothetical protein
MAEEKELSFNDKILNQLLSSNNNASKLQSLYRGSDLQKETYASLENDDLAYKQFITRTYGSYENYLAQNKINQNINVYDPMTDYIMDVTVITKDTSYKTDHISTQEVIMENLTGFCTVYFNKKSNGASRRLSCTLEQNSIPTSQSNTRQNFFSPQKGDRVVVWDLNAQGWKSFYMSSVIKFIRDDTTGLQ